MEILKVGVPLNSEDSNKLCCLGCQIHRVAPLLEPRLAANPFLPVVTLDRVDKSTPSRIGLLLRSHLARYKSQEVIVTGMRVLGVKEPVGFGLAVTRASALDQLRRELVHDPKLRQFISFNAIPSSYNPYLSIMERLTPEQIAEFRSHEGEIRQLSASFKASVLIDRLGIYSSDNRQPGLAPVLVSLVSVRVN